MKNPPWLTAAVAANASEVLRGRAKQAAASAAVAAAVKAHPEYIDELAWALADREVGRWLRDHETSGDLFQAQMFPGLPASMRIAPKRTVPVAAMTGEDLDHAKKMLYARTGNAAKGAADAADRERATFDRFYDRVRPLLDGELTVADVLAKLAVQENAA